MAEINWIFVKNTFEINTKGSHVKALALGVDHRDKLAGQLTDADIALIHTEYLPIITAYIQTDLNLKVASGTYAGKTDGFEEKLETLTENLKIWEGKTRAEFPEDTPTDTEIWPNKRNPFYDGTYESRLQAINALANKLLDFPALAATQALVASFYNTVQSARALQQQSEGSIIVLSNIREEQRLVMCNALYGNLGRLMYKYRNTRNQVASFFDLSLLQAGDSQLVLGGLLLASARVQADYGTRTIGPDTRITYVNNGTGAAKLAFGFARDTASEPEVLKEALAGESKEATAQELGYDPDNTVLMVINLTTQNTEWQVLIG